MQFVVMQELLVALLLPALLPQSSRPGKISSGGSGALCQRNHRNIILKMSLVLSVAVDQKKKELQVWTFKRHKE